MFYNFSIGDTVQLKSGGPVMTIESFKLPDESVAVCTWFKDKERKVDNFPIEILRKFRYGINSGFRRNNDV